MNDIPEEIQRNYDDVGAVAKLRTSERYRSVMEVTGLK